MTEKQEGKFDVVCGMDVSEFKDAEKITHEGEHYFFCSKHCEKRFKKNPERFKGEPVIRMRDVWKIFKMGEVDTKVLRGLNLNIWEGDFVAIIGASGSGKSTTLNMIGLLDRPTSGQVFLGGKDVSKLMNDEKRSEFRSKTFGFVFQQYNLTPWLTAFENVTMPRIFARSEIDEDKIMRDFEDIGLGKRSHHRPFELSGGEQQRVALLRALSNEPEIILGDEPTGNLDSKTGNKILDILIELNKKQGKTLIIVTHDADIAEMSDQIIAMRDGQVIRDHQSQKHLYTD